MRHSLLTRGLRFIPALAMALGGAVGFAVPSAPCQAADEPNIVLILVDDLGVDAIQGDHWPNQLGVHTPELASLASQGRSFTNARMNPICSPTRAALLTGRQALRTGVTGLIGDSQPTPDRDLLALQTEEVTIAETLRDAGYYTIQADKWHIGYGEGQLPTSQGFAEFIDGRDIWALDQPEVIGDEHITRLVDLAVDAVNNRPNLEDPYAIFMWPKDPHKRPKDSKGLVWWIMDPALQPSGEDYYSEPETNLKRFRGNVEALDTEIGRFLREINVIDAEGNYRPESNTLVLFLGDNGTDARVSIFGEQGKGTLYEGGIHVPCFAFGAGVPSDGGADDRLISHVDFYDTLADYVGLAENARGEAPRDGVSFADALGADIQPEFRTYSLSSEPRSNSQKHTVALVSEQYKLITRAGGDTQYHKVKHDQFYDLVNDPGEQLNLVNEGMNAEQAAAYAEMRDGVVDYWNTSVVEPFQNNSFIDPNLLPYTVDIPANQIMSLSSNDDVLTDSLIGGHQFNNATGKQTESRIYCTFDLLPLKIVVRHLPRLPKKVTAQLIIKFREDAGTVHDEDTPPLRVAAMLTDPFAPEATWDTLVNANHVTNLGMFDPPPHILTDPAGNQLRGVPMTPGTLVSFGRSDELLNVIETWIKRPNYENGLVILADDAFPEEGRQYVIFEPEIALRVTIYDWK